MKKYFVIRAFQILAFLLWTAGFFCVQNALANTGKVATGSTIENQNTQEIQFPEIIPKKQRSTTGNFSENTFTCEKEKCKINLNFEQIFNDNYPKKQYSCEISFQDTTRKNCNPPQWTLTGASEFNVKLTHKKSKKTKEKTFKIAYPFDNKEDESTKTGSGNTENTQTGVTNTGNTESGSTQTDTTETGNIQDENTNSGSIQNKSTNFGSTDTQSGSTLTENEVDFPEIFPKKQRSTSGDFSENIFTCDEKTCKINLNFEQIFNDNYPKKDFSCEIHFQNTTRKNCNPPQWTLTGSSEFTVKLIHKESQKTKEKIFKIEYPFDKSENKKPKTESGATENTNNTQTGTTNTGATQNKNENHSDSQVIKKSTQTGVIQEEIEAKQLEYRDEDGDQKIDTILLHFEDTETLTGSYQSGSLLLYSNTGGLYDEKINSDSEKIQSVTASGNILVVKITPSDFEKKILTISKGTSSDLRLKNTKDVGFVILKGAKLKKI